MKKHFWKTAIITMGLALCVAPGAGASYTTETVGSFTTYFGEDEGNGETTTTIPGTTATGAEAAFLSQLSGITTESFENFENNTFKPFNTATISGIDANDDVKTTPSTGRYGIGEGTYIATKNNFSIKFENNISAFGFYGIDITDFDSEDLQINLYTNTSSTPFKTLSISSAYKAFGSVLYFGFYSTTETFNKIEFVNSANGDVYGFDKMSIGTPVPLPPSALMLGSGLLGLMGLLKTRRRPQ